MEASMDLWKLPREVWSTTAEAILPEASGCFHGSVNYHFHRKSQSLLPWKLVRASTEAVEAPMGEVHASIEVAEYSVWVNVPRFPLLP